MTKDQLIKLREDIIHNEIEPKKAGEIVYLNKIKSWHTTEWKKKRSTLLKESCEQCGSKEILTIQHTWHPRDYGIIKRDICGKYGQLINEKYTVEDLINEKEVENYFNININQQEKEICIKCGSVNISARKTLSPKYRCNHCKELFEAPVKKLLPIFIDDRKQEILQEMNVVTYSELSWKIYKEKCKELLFKEYGEQIEKETIITVIDESLRYISLADTVTFCKKCAFIWDKKGMNICPICKTRYKKICNRTCYECKEL
ncbi:hypothetical protein [Clostridium estertheticum]|uniref:Uncharacterized protein n=1 Tax=Clostridium estertheticum TaxID=238834 RepID=A0A7Y3WTH3_9CLOT|nr:hypothetical protein [Clostridium estertheticum]NNU78177.1 hypothetical protein [Clostridium estertheticum]WBL47711.1 hypothetical protein LOR37_03205 [Clostridium estertheticum]